MSYILCIETATEICSVALSDNEKLVASIELKEKNSHSGQITLLIDQLMRISEIELKQLAVVAVSKGPGSYTGLRVGVSTAKGLCYALDIPLIGIETLDSLARNFISTPNLKPQTSNFFIPMLDARRMEVYCKIFDEKLNRIRETKAEIIDENSFHDYLEKGIVCFFGEGAMKCKNIITHKNALFVDEVKCLAKSMVIEAYKRFNKKQFEVIAYFEPFYLKDFVGIKPNNPAIEKK